mmetsp:Transcript_2592/g.10857  ORF Transcript_2592/g.10857 Transcript_2592/m.10857 type:complete len:261 (+) Transcript_2592:1727-2509(+)
MPRLQPDLARAGVVPIQAQVRLSLRLSIRVLRQKLQAVQYNQAACHQTVLIFGVGVGLVHSRDGDFGPRGALRRLEESPREGTGSDRVLHVIVPSRGRLPFRHVVRDNDRHERFEERGPRGGQVRALVRAEVHSLHEPKVDARRQLRRIDSDVEAVPAVGQDHVLGRDNPRLGALQSSKHLEAHPFLIARLLSEDRRDAHHGRLHGGDGPRLAEVDSALADCRRGAIVIVSSPADLHVEGEVLHLDARGGVQVIVRITYL